METELEDLLPLAKVVHLRANIKDFHIANVIKETQMNAGMNCHILCEKPDRWEVVWHKAWEECKYCQRDLEEMLRD